MLKNLHRATMEWWHAPRIAHITLQGNIDHNTTHTVTRSLEYTTKWYKGSKAIALTVNSAGGSSAQSLIIVQKIRNYCKNKKIPLYTFGEEQACSAGYLVLSSGDKVYVENSSVVGSIGAIYQMWYLNKLLTKVGLEYRSIHTGPGSLTSLIDPLEKYNKKKVTAAMTISVNSIQAKFLAQVKSMRGDKLSENLGVGEGEIYTGRRAVELGLADEIGNFSEVLEREFKNPVIVNVMPQNKMSASIWFETFQISSESGFLKRLLAFKIMKQKKDIQKAQDELENYY
jgi:signal peptide peptidase SppA